ncbi:MAG: type II toxin-antitoxin system prevent-host-death family antitoxin [Bacteroidales bacterium]|nr:type II toxin-antitoxin system Phd/YefM family antitoxin [Lentimicrobiaceae bacterium]MBQ2852313.1 type II toxin-antitoxin system prevent-host-death family antitoxin [Bacteroidales bacterium]
MLIISSREFRANTGRYLDMVANGIDVILKSRNSGSFRLVPVKESDVVMSEKEFYEKVNRSIMQAEEGKIIRQNDGENVEDFVDRMLCTE